VIPSAFEYERATSIDDALAKLAATNGAGKLIAGGHSLVPLMKLRLNEPATLIDIARIAAARSGAPDAVLRLDANGSWDLEVARAMLAATVEQGVELIEQPVEASQIEQLSSLRGSSTVRTAADESMLLAPAKVIEGGAADAVVLKPMLLGGPRIAMALAVAGLVAEGEMRIEEAGAAEISYPSFWRDLSTISGTVA